MVKEVARKLFVEGGGDRNPRLHAEVREAFRHLFERAGVARKLRVIPCGGRKAAYDQFCHALALGEEAWLLVDAEEVPSSDDPWLHVAQRVGDGWTRPAAAGDDRLHLMTVVMETWLLSDPRAVEAVLGRGFDAKKLPAATAALEGLEKARVYAALDAATRKAARPYGKGEHAFKILGRLSPDALAVLPRAGRFLAVMRSL